MSKSKKKSEQTGSSVEFPVIPSERVKELKNVRKDDLIGLIISMEDAATEVDKKSQESIKAVREEMEEEIKKLESSNDSMAVLLQEKAERIQVLEKKEEGAAQVRQNIQESLNRATESLRIAQSEKKEAVQLSQATNSALKEAENQIIGLTKQIEQMNLVQQSLQPQRNFIATKADIYDKLVLKAQAERHINDINKYVSEKEASLNEQAQALQAIQKEMEAKKK